MRLAYGRVVNHRDVGSENANTTRSVSEVRSRKLVRHTNRITVFGVLIIVHALRLTVRLCRRLSTGTIWTRRTGDAKSSGGKDREDFKCSQIKSYYFRRSRRNNVIYSFAKLRAIRQYKKKNNKTPDSPKAVVENDTRLALATVVLGIPRLCKKKTTRVTFRINFSAFIQFIIIVRHSSSSLRVFI